MLQGKYWLGLETMRLYCQVNWRVSNPNIHVKVKRLHLMIEE